MVSEIITISNDGENINDALNIAEKVSAYEGLDHKKAIRLRLLAEELIGIMRGITGQAGSDFWIETDKGVYSLYLKTNVFMNQELYTQFIDVSSSGKNAASKGLTGKIREYIAFALLPSSNMPLPIQNPASNIMTLGNISTYENNLNAFAWSLYNYKQSLENSTSHDSEEAWDELEKSIVANIADDVQVSVTGSLVEIKITKAM